MSHYQPDEDPTRVRPIPTWPPAPPGAAPPNVVPPPGGAFAAPSPASAPPGGQWGQPGANPSSVDRSQLPPPPTGGVPYPGAAPYPGGYQPYGPMAMVNPFESRGSTVMVLGILALVVCGPILGPIAWVMGNTLRKDAAAAGYPEPGNGKAGRICGIVATAIWGVLIAFYIVAVVIAISTSQTTTY